MMWKLLTGIMGEKLYHHLERNGLLKDEQKGCMKGSRGTKGKLFIGKAILKNCRRRLTNLSFAWIDYKKAYDMVEMVGTAKNIISTISNTMVNSGADLGGGCRGCAPPPEMKLSSMYLRTRF